jgi:hypothetical protein
LNSNTIHMKRNLVLAAAVIVSIVFLLSFQTEKPLLEKNGLRVYELKGSPDFPDAALELVAPLNGASLLEAKDTFNFRVKNFQLGAQTADAAQKMCANSSKGQHIHFIMDNAPYVASYSTEIVSEMKPGHHVLLAFLSRSYHESLKHKEAYLLKEFNVGKAAKDNFDEKEPHLFYSRPKGEYIGDQETKRLMLDFYLINCQLSADGYKVRATINGNEFLLTKWVPYVIEGLPLGEVKIKLELLDRNNKLVASPFNGVERTSTLKDDPSRN